MTLETIVRRILRTGRRRQVRHRRSGIFAFTLMLASVLFELLRGMRRRVRRD